MECALESAPEAKLAAKLALRAARAALWLDDVERAEGWLAHAVLTNERSTKPFAAVSQSARACRDGAAATSAQSNAARSAVAAGGDADSISLLRARARPERNELFVSGHDVATSLLQGTQRPETCDIADPAYSSQTTALPHLRAQCDLAPAVPMVSHRSTCMAAWVRR